jgi:colicin import membrane protein
MWPRKKDGAEPEMRAEARRPRRRRIAGGWRALLYALGVHVVLLAMLFVGLRWTTRDDAAPIQAYVAESPPASAAAPPPVEPEREARKAEERRMADSERQRHEAEAARAAAEEERRRAEERRIALEKRAAEEKRRVEEERKRADAKRRAEEEKRQAEAKRKQQQQQQEAELRKQAEEALRQQLEEETSARQAEAKRREDDRKRLAMAASKGTHVAAVRQRVSRNWIRPPGAPSGLKCTVFVRLAPGGDVLEVRVTRSSGNVAFDRSVENAVHKAVPLPVPNEPELFEQFREIEFVFVPEE